MGSDERAETSPERDVYVSPFWLDVTEVTVARYRECLGAAACRLDSTSEQVRNYLLSVDDDAKPMVYLRWEHMVEYCRWAGGRLPTEAEWEHAARGGGGRRYPWGADEASCDRANWDNCVGDLVAVGSYPMGASPDGILDLIGNVHEVVSDEWKDGYDAYSPPLDVCDPNAPFESLPGSGHVLRGCSFRDPTDLCTGFHRQRGVGGVDAVGLRCARDGTRW